MPGPGRTTARSSTMHMRDQPRPDVLKARQLSARGMAGVELANDRIDALKAEQPSPADLLSRIDGVRAELYRKGLPEGLDHFDGWLRSLGPES